MARRIGYDRELRLEWLDAAAAQAAAGATARGAREWLNRYLAADFESNKHGGARDKTIVKLCTIWLSPPPPVVSLRDRAIQLLAEVDTAQRIALHWGLAMVAYPFFGSVTDAVGRLIALQDNVQRSGIVRRMYESWGERPFVNRATRAVWNSLLLWGVLEEHATVGNAHPPTSKLQLCASTEVFLIEAVIQWSGGRPLALSSLSQLPCLFPFELDDASTVARTSGRVRVSREGSNNEVVRGVEAL